MKNRLRFVCLAVAILSPFVLPAPKLLRVWSCLGIILAYTSSHRLCLEYILRNLTDPKGAV